MASILGFPSGPQMHLLHLEIRFGLPLSCRSFIAFNDVLIKDNGLLVIAPVYSSFKKHFIENLLFVGGSQIFCKLVEKPRQQLITAKFQPVS